MTSVVVVVAEIGEEAEAIKYLGRREGEEQEEEEAKEEEDEEEEEEEEKILTSQSVT